VTGRHALVLGGSLAGLLAARVLCDHFDRVTVVERDVFPNAATPRRGVPQANHVHALMPRGRQILEKLFPPNHFPRSRAIADRKTVCGILSAFHAGLKTSLLLGDSVCAFNPVHGQGMTIAAMGATALDECLRENPALADFSKRFQKRLTKVTAAPWMLATSEDYRYRETEGGLLEVVG
ncbi:MAG: hypothetical protein ACREBC_38080, partial [Pyrinomonadaceae bacterium]